MSASWKWEVVFGVTCLKTGVGRASQLKVPAPSLPQKSSHQEGAWPRAPRDLRQELPPGQEKQKH